MTEREDTADSAGVPWQGRHFEPNPFAADDGAADPRLLAALADFRRGREDRTAVIDAVRGARLLVPLIAEVGEIGVNTHGSVIDKSSELSIVTVAGPDGRKVMPAFTSAEAMRSWKPAARPVPVDAVRLALAAVSEDTELVILDPTASTEFAIRRPALWAIARQSPWSLPETDPEVTAAFRDPVGLEVAVPAISVTSGDPASRLAAPEILVTLALAPGLDQLAIAALLQRLHGAWSDSPTITERVDSLSVKLVPATDFDVSAAN